MAWLHASWTEWKNLFSFEIIGRDGKLKIDGLGGSYGTERLTFYRMLPQMGPPETTSWEFPFRDRSLDDEFDEFRRGHRRAGAPAIGDIERRPCQSAPSSRPSTTGAAAMIIMRARCASRSAAAAPICRPTTATTTAS